MSYAKAVGEQVPEDTARVARAVFVKGNPYLRLRDTLGVVYQSADYRALFDHRGQPAISPGLLALVTAMQYAEGLTDRQAADAVRSRIDWKYVLGLELTDQGFDYSVLSEFRGRLVTHQTQLKLLEDLLQRLGEADLLSGTQVQRTDSTHVLASIRSLNRLELVGETLRHTLEVLAVAYPEWLLAHVSTDWFDRYGARFEEYRLPNKVAEREALAVSIGQDGLTLLTAAKDAPAALQGLPAVTLLGEVWAQQFRVVDGQVFWRSPEELPAAREGIQSPFDPDARWSFKRSKDWTGYKVHLTECCGPDGPHLITDVQTTPATTPDVVLTEPVQTALLQRDLKPQQHLVDAGYPDAGALVSSAKRGIDLVGPVPADTSWQARDPSGYDLSRFAIDWAARVVHCPQEQTSITWSPSKDSHGNAVIHVRFASSACDSCPQREHCTRARGPRSLKLRPQAEHEALSRARARQATQSFWDTYSRRAGVEGTISQGVRCFDLRRTRYRGLAKTSLHAVIVAVALNLTRVAAWLAGQRPAGTRCSHFLALRPVLCT